MAEIHKSADIDSLRTEEKGHYSHPRELKIKIPNYIDKTLKDTSKSIERINYKFLKNSDNFLKKRASKMKLHDKLSKSVESRNFKNLDKSLKDLKMPGNINYSKLLHKYHLKLSRNKMKLKGLASNINEDISPSPVK